MFEQKPLSENLNQKFNDLNAENFTLFGINIGGKKKENEYDYNEVEAAEMLNKRRKANAGIIEQNLLNDPNRIENRIKNKVIKPPVRGYKRPKFDLDGAIGAIGDLLIGGKKKKKENEYDYNEVEAAEMLNKRRKANAGIIEQNLLNDPNRIENRIKNKVIKPPVRGYKRPKFDLDGAIGAIGDLLTGNAGKQPDLTLNEGAELGLDRTGQSTLPTFVATSKKKNNNTVFYIIIAVLVVIGTFLLIKKNK